MRGASPGGHSLARAAAGSAAFVLCSRAARRGSVGPAEAGVFDAVNTLPSWAHAPVWAVMQIGSLGGVVAMAAGARATGRPRLAADLLRSGGTTWVLAKAAKRVVRRGRPSTTLETWRTLGRPQTGLGYPSGHAAVAVALAAVASPSLPRRWRGVVWAVAAVPGLGRIYVGAHLPLDVAGGAALGDVVAVTAGWLGGRLAQSSSAS